MPSFPIVDSHVHLYDVARLHYPWLRAVPKIDRTYLLKDFDAAYHFIDNVGTVFYFRTDLNAPRELASTFQRRRRASRSNFLRAASIHRAPFAPRRTVESVCHSFLSPRIPLGPLATLSYHGQTDRQAGTLHFLKTACWLDLYGGETHFLMWSLTSS